MLLCDGVSMLLLLGVMLWMGRTNSKLKSPPFSTCGGDGDGDGDGDDYGDGDGDGDVDGDGDGDGC
jgi:hypothetical protein